MAPSTRQTPRAAPQSPPPAIHPALQQQQMAQAGQQQQMAQAGFALAPGLGSADVLDFTTAEAKDIFKYSTKGLYSDTEQKFDGSADNLQTFLFQLKVRADSFGWAEHSRILDINVDIGATNERRNLLLNYGTITVDQVREHARQYISTPSRNAQDSYMLQQAIWKSLDNKVINKIRNKTVEYTVDGFVPGELLLRVVIREVYTDTNATLARIHRQLQDLPKYMETVANDIEKFNLYVEDLEAQLAARGHKSTELITHLFTAYGTVKDSVFVRYIEAKQNQYDEGKDFKTQELMATALAKFQTRKDAGVWEAQTPEQEQITALTAQLVQLKDQNKKLSKWSKKKGGTDQKVNDVAKQSNNQPQSSQSKKKNKNIPPWKLVPPTEEEQRAGSKKMVKTNWYSWCPKHQMWTIHKPEDCKGVGYKPNKTNNSSAPKSATAQETVIAPYVREE